ncbi:MAG: redoxin domain-containing protein [Planctomycetes bacterium]|nr:redoxin domain-containing protein [Planctomycetota bacterium]
MTRTVSWAAAVVLLALASACAKDDKAAPRVGEMAPDFQLRGSDGKDYRLSDFAGKEAVVVAWFPKAFTGG